MRLAIILTVGILAIVAGVSAGLIPDQVPEGNSKLNHDVEKDVEKTANLATSLTDQEKEIVQSTWAYVRNNPLTIGVIILYSYFKHFPEYKQLFSQLKDVPQARLPSNKDFQTLSLNIVNSLGNVIDSLNDEDSLKASISAIGERNREHKITKELVQDLKQVILRELRHIFGPDLFTNETTLVWGKVIDIAFSGLFLSGNEDVPIVRANAYLANGLTIQQKTIVQSAWANLKNSSLAYTVVILYNYFHKYPQYQQLFRKIKNVPLNSLPRDEDFLDICLEITTALGNVIESPNEPDSLKTNHSASGERNHEFEYPKELFQNLKQEILHVLRLIYGPGFTVEAAEAWNKTINLALSSKFADFLT